MFEQTPINRLNGKSWELPSDINHDQAKHDRGGVKQLLADVTELAELQTRLMADDVRSSLAATVKPTLFVVVSIALLIGTVPVLLFAVANLLVDQQQWSPHMAQFTCAAVALLIAVSLGSLALQKFKQCASPLQRSLDELEKNMDTLREMLVGKEEANTNRRSPK
ncbi:MAG: phage holin family protein [Bythopirellula sp.]|nr:phage holin family protein [Bythopirellula sp.]